MIHETSEILKRALTLPDRERAELAGNLLDSLDNTIDEDVDAAWQQEIARRLAQIRAGKRKTIPWSEVRKKGHVLLNGK
jgi:putative addiction module component (TIGR02574 family)